MSENKLALVNLICVKSGVTGANLETLRAQLLKKGEEELRSLLAGTYDNMMKGLVIEHNSSEKPAEAGQNSLFFQGFSDEQAQQAAIDEIQSNIDDAYNIYNSQHLGAITGAYDRSKAEDNKLASKNVWKVIQYQMDGAAALTKARDNRLTRREYFEQNLQRIKDMILMRLDVLQTTTGSTMLDSLRGKFSKEQTREIISDYVDEVLSTATMEEIKNLQKQLVTQSGSVEVQNLTNLTNSAIKLHEQNLNKPEKPKDIMSTEIEMSKIPIDWATEEPVSFGDVYKYERGCEYDKNTMGHLIQAKAEMQTVVNAYNKYAQFEDFSKKLLDSDKTAQERASDLLSGYAGYYMLSGDGGKSELNKIIEKSKLPISLDENGLNLGAYATEREKQMALDKLIKLGTQQQKARLDKILGNKTIQDYQRDYERYSSAALGEDDAKFLSEAMKADNMGVIQRYTGPVAMIGMGLTFAGGVLCFAPLALLGTGLAIGSMVAESGLGYTDAFTKDEASQEEWDDLNKNLVMNAAGFIVGYGAGKVGMKAFGKLIDKKLADVFKTSINEGNRIAALKNVISNPEMLKNFMTAAGAKISADFMISYAGDLMMMGILDTNDDWKSLLKANLIGIVVGMSGDIKDVAGVSKVKADAPANHRDIKPEIRVPEGTKGDFPETPVTSPAAEQVSRPAEYLVKSPDSPEFKEIELSVSEKLKAKMRKQDPEVLLQDKRLDAYYKANSTPEIQENVAEHLDHIYSRMVTEMELGESAAKVPYNTPVKLPDGTTIVRKKVQKLNPYYERNGYEETHGLPNEPKEIISMTSPDGQTRILPVISDGSVNSAKRVLDVMGKALAKEENSTYTSRYITSAEDIAKQQARQAKINQEIDNIKTKDDLITYLEQYSGYADGEKILNKANLTEVLEHYNETNMQNLKNVLKYLLGEDPDGGYSSLRILNLKNDFIENPDNADFIKQFLFEKSADEIHLIDARVADRTFIFETPDAVESAKTLVAIKNKTDNPILNIDNIILMANGFKGKESQFYDNLADILNIKDKQGNYVLNAENFPLGDNDAIDFLMKDTKFVHPEVVDLFNKKTTASFNGTLGKKDASLTGANIMNAIYEKNPDISVEELVAQTKEFFVDKKITDPRLVEIENQYLSTDLNKDLFDIQVTMKDVKDERILQYINKQLDEVNTANLSNWQSNKKIKEIQEVLDIYHSVNGNYVNIGSRNFIPYYRGFIKYINKTNPELAERLTKEPALIEDPEYKALRQDFLNDMQFGQLVNYCKDHPNSELSEYFYENYFLKNINLPQDVKLKCIEMNNKYGVKIIPSANIKEVKEVFDYLDKEFAEWQTVSQGQAKLPPVLDCLTSKQEYFDPTSAYGEGAAGGFAEAFNSRSISLSKMTLETVQYAIRHEITHINTPKCRNVMWDSIAPRINVTDAATGQTKSELDLPNCKYRDEFLKAGINPFHLEYAYNNVFEFIAVAAEGDMSKYSPEFKKLLINLGMPEYMFNMKVLNPEIKSNVAEVEMRMEMYSDKTPEEIYFPEYFEPEFEPKVELEVVPETSAEAGQVVVIQADKMITYASNGNKVPVEEINEAVQEIQTRYAGKEADIRKYLGEAGLGEIGNMKGRLKSESSLYDKIANYMEEHPNATLDEAMQDVRDAFGARTVIDTDYDYKNHPEVKALLDNGDERGAMQRAAEIQSQPALEKLKGVLLAQSQNKEGLETVRISNYVSADGIPYFSEAQLAELKQYGASIGVNVNYIAKIDESDPNYAKMKAEGLKPATKAQPSGYTALQVNFATKTGEIIEWQYRGDKVDRFAEGEHIPYDLRTGKNIIGEHKELEPLYNPIKELLSKDNMPEAAYNEYNRYLTDYYTHLRKLELGFDSIEPKLSDYGNGFKFDERLNAENLVALHEVADKLKNAKITEQEAINEYNAAVQKNTPALKTDKANLLKRIESEGVSWFPEEMNVIRQKLPQIKDEKILDAIETELNSNKFVNIRNILALCEIENFKTGGYEALSPELKNLIQPSSHYTKKDLNVRLEEIKAIQDPVLRQEKLDEFNVNVLSSLMVNQKNGEITDYLYDNYLLPAIPERYRQTMTEIHNAAGKKVLPAFSFENKNDSYIQLSFEALVNYNNLSDFQKDLLKKHADMMLHSDYWLTASGYDAIKTLTVEDIKIFEERNLAKYIDSTVPKVLPELIKLDETYWNKIQKFDLLKYTKFEYDKVTKQQSPSTSVSNIIDIVKQCSDEEIQNMIKRNIFGITPKGLSTLESDMMIALAKLDDSQWDYVVNDLHLIKDNVLDIHNNDINGGLEAVCARWEDYEKASANIVKFLSNLNMTKSFADELTSLGFKPETATAEIGHLYNGVNPADTKDFKFNSTTWEEKITKVENEIEKTVYEHPELYVNGEYASREDCNAAIAEFFNDKNKLRLAELDAAIDKEGMNHLMRKRFDDVKEYLDITDSFNIKDFELLTNLCNSYNSSGKPFMPTQKVEFIDLINAYKINGLDTSKMEAMIAAGRVDVAELHMDLFNKIMKNTGMTDEEIASIPMEKLSSWNIKYTHLLAKEIQGEFDFRDDLHIPTEAGDKTFSDLIRAANLDDFNRYIHDETNVYGKSNANTKRAFDESGINYKNWINPPKSAEVHFTAKDKNLEHLQQISDQLLEDINILRQTPVKGFIDKQFPGYIKNGEFVMPAEIASNKAKLKEFVNNVIKQLDSVWKRARGNVSSDDAKRAAMAKNTLTVLSHLQTRLEDIENIPSSTVQKSLDLTVKMWDRNPQKDIFQGNYSTCCIGMGGGNGSAMPHYLMNTSYNMIELVDNTTGNTIGNALVYFVKDKDGEPAFIIDNIEINNSVKPSNEGGLKLRDSIVEYASNVAKAATGRDNINIYMSGSYNDVPCSDLPVENKQISFLGDLDTENIYMDLYKGWVDKSGLTGVVQLLKLK